MAMAFVIFMAQFHAEARAEKIKTCDEYSAEELRKKAGRYLTEIRQAADDHDVSPALIKAVITAESCFRQRARSHRGAMGLMQLMPATARQFGASNGLDPAQNIDAGTRYLKYLLKRYEGSVVHAIAAYNAGEGRIRRHGSLKIPFHETRLYVRRVMNAFSKLEEGGAVRKNARLLLDKWDGGRVISGSVVKLAKLPVDNTGDADSKPKLVLAALEDFAEIPGASLTDVAPGLLESDAEPVIQINDAPEQVVVTPVPQQQMNCRQAPQALVRQTRLQGSGRYGAFFYNVRSGDSIPQIAAKLGVDMQTVLHLNNFQANAVLSPGRMLRVAECVRTSG